MTKPKAKRAEGNASANASASLPAAASEGQRRLREYPGSLAELAAKLGVSKPMVHRWRTGEKKPGPEGRAKLQKVLGIAAASWAQQAGASGKGAAKGQAPAGAEARAAPPASAVGSRAERPTTLEECYRLLEQIDQAMDQKREGGLMPSELARMHDTKTKTLALRARLEKDQELLEDSIVWKHPAFQRATTALYAALKDHPAAARAVAAALAEVMEDAGA